MKDSKLYIPAQRSNLLVMVCSCIISDLRVNTQFLLKMTIKYPIRLILLPFDDWMLARNNNS